MTSEYDHLGRDDVRLSQAVCQQWLHSSVLNKDFVSQWKAWQMAEDLATEVGYSSAIRIDVWAFSRSKKRRPTVRFGAAVQVRIVDHSSHRLAQWTIDESMLERWDAKPWTLVPCDDTPDFDDACRVFDDQFSLMQMVEARHELPSPDWMSVPGHPAEARATGPLPPNPADPEGQHVDFGPDGPTDDDFDCSSSQSSHSMQQVYLFRLGAPAVFGRIDWTDYGCMMMDAARLLGVEADSLIALHDVHSVLDDIPEGVVPLIAHLEEDLEPGEPSRLCLVDYEMHGNVGEDHYRTAPVVDRQVLVTPSPATVPAIFERAGVDLYCRMESNRCFMFYNRRSVLAQWNPVLPIVHGDHLRIVIPPPLDCDLPTQIVLAQRQQIPASDMVDSPSSARSDVSPSLIQADELREQLGLLPPEELALFQVSADLQLPVPARTPYVPTPRTCSFTDEFLQAMRLVSQAQEPVPEFPVDPAPDLRTMPLVIQDLFAHWSQQATLGPGQIEMLARVETWYSDHWRFQRCYNSRVVVLAADFHRWEQQLVDEWRDLVIPTIPVGFHLVHPMPEDAASNVIAQIILVQQPDPRQRSVLLSIYDNAFDEGRPHTHAVLTTDRVRRDSILLAAQVHEECAPQIPGMFCSVWFGTRELHADDSFPTRHGFMFKLLIHRGVEPGLSELRLLDDDQLRSRLHDMLSPQFPLPIQEAAVTDDPVDAGIPDPPTYLPDWINELQLAFDHHAAIEREDEGPVAYFSTWFLNGRFEPHCGLSRTVRLRSDFTAWTRALLDEWRDHLDSQWHPHLYFVDPPPVSTPTQSIAGHVVILQEPVPHYAAIVLSIHVPGSPLPAIQHLATYVPEWLTVAQAVFMFGIPATESDSWTARRGRLRFTPTERHRVGNGDAITLEPAIAREPEASSALPDVDQDESTFLQTSPTMFTPAVVKEYPARRVIPKVQISLQACLLETPAYDPEAEYYPEGLCWTRDDWAAGISDCEVTMAALPEGLSLAPPTFHAMTCPVEYRDRDHANATVLFVDGSADGRDAAWSVVQVDYDAEGIPALVGCLAGHVPIATNHPGWIGAEHFDNIAAELTAACAALITGLCGNVASQVVVRPDLRLSAMLALQQWDCHAHPVLTKLCCLLGQWFTKVGGTFHEVRGHQGDPWNELADRLARHQLQLEDTTGILNWVTFSQLCRSSDFAWAWLLDASAAMHRCFPPGSEHGIWQITPSLQRCPVVPQSIASFPRHLIDFTVMSANVLALGQTDETLPSSSASERVLRLDRQWHEMHVAVIGLQETRRSEGTFRTEHYTCFSSGAQQCRRAVHFGCELWIHRFVALDPKKTLFLKDFKTAVAHADPRRLIVHLQHAACDMSFVVLHVPCCTSQFPVHDLKRWWEETISLLEKIPLAELTWCLADANAPLASETSPFFGLAGAEPSNEQGLLLQQALERLEWYAPTTMPWCHQGQHTTWMHPRGHRSRKDYVFCSRHAFDMCADSRVVTSHDGGFGHEDHLPVCLHLQGWIHLECPDERLQWDPVALADPTQRRLFQQALQSMPSPIWTTHVDSHAQLLETNILALAQQFFGRRTTKRSRPRLSESTLNLIALKRSCLDYGRANGLMADPCFKQELKNLEHDVRRLVNADQKAFYAQLVQQLADAGDLHDARMVYRLLTRLGGKKAKSAGPRPLPLLRQQGEAITTFSAQQRLWLRQFAEVEAGNIMNKSEFLRTIPAHLGISPADFDINIVPTLDEIKVQLHRLKNGKAPGPDRIPPDILKAGADPLAKHLAIIMAKISAQGHEPGTWRSGKLVPLHKGKLAKDNPQGYRAIFLNSFITKIYHAILRQHLVQAWHSVLTHIQFGGRRGLGCDSAHHVVQAHLAHGAHFRLASAVLFVDFKSAFYTVLRQGLFDRPLDATGFMTAMHRMGIHPDHVSRLLQQADRDVAVKNISPHAVTLLLDVLSATCFELDGLDEVAATNRGTRPGDPIGDVAFNLTMALILKDVTETMQSTDAIWEGQPAAMTDFTQQFPPAPHAWAEVAYVDDLAVLLRAPSNDSLLDLVHASAAAVLDAAEQRGLELTFGAGKTEVMTSWRGPRTRHYREMIAAQNNKIMIPHPDKLATCALPVVMAYKHLGTWLHNDAKPLHAVRDRIAAAKKAWGPLSKSFFGKKNVAIDTKVQVFNSLVMSRFLFNAHTWAWIAEKHLDTWEAGLRPMLYQLARPCLKGHPPFKFSVETLCGLCHVATPRDQLHLARLRYVKRMLDTCPAILWNLLQTLAEVEESWLVQLRSSLKWLVRFSHRAFGLSASSAWHDWFAFIRLDGRWKGRLKRALSSCVAYRKANADTEVWLQSMRVLVESEGVELPSVQPAQSPLQWTCSLCDKKFGSKRALAMHAVHVHQYKTVVKHYAVDGSCPNCGRHFHCRARLCAHLRHAQQCLLRIRAAFPALSVEEMSELDENDQAYATQMKAQGWLPTKAGLPALRVQGPWLPPEGSADALAMFAKSLQRKGHDGAAYYEGLQGLCEQPLEDFFVPPGLPEDAAPDHDISFVMHSAHGREHGVGGRFSMQGLARIYAQLHIKTYCFVHFYSGFRRLGDIQHQLDNHIIQNAMQIFCLSIDFCLQGASGDLTTNASRKFWTRQIRSGAVCGIGGGPPCETFTAVRLLGDGPPPVRSHDDLWGLPCNTRRQWQQTNLGSVLVRFIIDMALLCALSGGCAFIEHPAYPVWAIKQRPASIWTSAAMKMLRKLHCVSSVTFDQCIFACPGRKPTTFLLVRMPWLRERVLLLGEGGRCPHHRGYHEALQGRRADGSFRTSVAKIYPPALNGLIADSVVQFVSTTFDLDPPLEALDQDLHALSRMDFVSKDFVQPDCYLDM